MANGVSLICGGGANAIGASFVVLKAGDTVLGFDYGGQLDPSLGFEPDHTVTDTLDHLFLTHAHRDHVEAVPVARKRFPGVKIYATPETMKLSQIIWDQTLRHAEEGKAPFTEDDAHRTLGSIRPIRVGEVVELGSDLRVHPIYAAHILGAVSYLVEYRGKFYFLTGDICYTDRSLLAGATQLQVERTAALIRESTYINAVKDRESEKARIISRVPELIGKGFQILVAALSIDRAQDVYCILAPIAEELDVPLYLDGSKRVFRIYRDNLPNGKALDGARWFDGETERTWFRLDREPGIVIASSGMMMPGTLSAKWAREFLPDPKAAIFTVNYQDPSTPGYQVRNSVMGDILAFEGRVINRQCLVEHFDLSAHMDKNDGEELEGRMNPETIVYVHGEDDAIDRYLSERGDSGRRIKSQIGRRWPLADLTNVSRAKFHPVFGGDIRAALEATMPPDTKLVVTPGGQLLPELVYQNDRYVRIYYPAVVEGDLARGDWSARISFVPWVDESEVEYHSLCLWGQAADAKNFSVHFGRFGETECFTFENLKRPNIHLDFFGKRREQFIPLYARVRDRRADEMVNLLIEGAVSDTIAELLLRRVEFSQLPPCLQHLRTQ